ncbi:MAG: family 78 glycoside hydrolase catalytic domain [Oscillospiraceae bacterium]|nr:family 78 glycoside hydrolase catalytic domain [Oscillospiraceae bacterium]
MEFPKQFICASEEFSSYQKFVPAPYFRKTFFADTDKCRLLVSGLGFYRVWINGKEITKGLLAPYISNPDDIVYFDEYDLSPYIRAAEKNVLGFQLGNGMQNAPGGSIWDFDKAGFRSSPKLSFLLETGKEKIVSDSSVKTAPSPLYFDDLRAGVRYDARNEIPGWNLPDFNDENWKNALLSEPPKGEKRICEAESVLPTGEELKAKEIRRGRLCDYIPRDDVPEITVPEDKNDGREGFLYDFGKNNAGIIRLKINGRAGQRVIMQFGELAKNGELDYNNTEFYPDGFAQRDVYICKGGEEVFEPPFTYHGFRYCLVMGIDEWQATDDLLTFIICTSATGTVGHFSCSDETANTLYEMCDRSDRSNFYYFPTDCPHREKNGWTGDAALSSEHMLMTMRVGRSYMEWLRNIRAAQREDGSLPGIIPTAGWGYEWGNGPAWDCALIFIPYFTYIYTGNKAILEENAAAILKYLRYAAGKRNKNGLLAYGLGDWCPIGGEEKSTLEFTDSVTVMSCAQKSAFIFDILGLKEEKAYAETLYGEMRNAIRSSLIAPETLAADTGCQTSQAMALYYGVFNSDEKEKAEKYLINIIHKNDDFLDVGILGARVIFHALSEAGESELAYKMITRKEFPSYGALIGFGDTTLPEWFSLPEETQHSHNHHMYCDIKNWFISAVAGLRFNPAGRDRKKVLIKPAFIKSLTFAEADYICEEGKISVRWERTESGISLTLTAPESISYEIALPDGSTETGTGCKKVSF